MIITSIKNWNYHRLEMDFSSMFDGNDHPSDIDMLYLCKDRTLIIGEIKNETGEFRYGQRRLLESIIDGWGGDGLILYIVHSGYWQKGDRVVNIGQCNVQEIYAKQERRWRMPKRRITVKEVLDYYMQRGS